MLHLLFLYFIVVYTVGCAALIVIASVYWRTRTRLSLAYLIFYLAFTVKVVLSGASLYIGLNVQDESMLNAIGTIDGWTTLFFSCTIVYFMHWLFSNSRLRLVEAGFYAAAVVLFLWSAFQPSGGSAYLLLALVSLYSLFPSFLSMKRPEALLRGMGITMIVGMIVFLLLIFLPIFFANFLPFYLEPVQLQLFFFPLFYCFHGILFARLFLRDLGQIEALELASLEGFGLTEREIEVIELVAAGKSNKAIGEKLFISLPTVKKHLSNIYRKIGITTRYQLIHRLKQATHRSDPGPERAR